MELSKLAQGWLESWQSDQSLDGKKISAEEITATFELAKSDGVNLDEYQAMGEIISHIKKLETRAHYSLHSSANGPFTWLWHAQRMTQDYSVEGLIFKDHLPPSLALEKYVSGLSLTSSTVPYTEKMFDGLEYYCGRLPNNYIFNNDVCPENTLWLKSNGKPPLDLQVRGGPSRGGKPW
ncbi:MAG: hypothetical protein HYU97_00875 [Deltaproteobacteria bacterium]|nr:hypothetical protein [Deltaproteobacteria bacterium]